MGEKFTKYRKKMRNKLSPDYFKIRCLLVKPNMFLRLYGIEQPKTNLNRIETILFLKEKSYLTKYKYLWWGIEIHKRRLGSGFFKR